MKKEMGVVKKTIIFLILIISSVSTLYPIVFMFLNSLKERFEYFENIFGFPQVFYFDNYRMIFAQFNILKYFANSMFIAIMAIVISFVFGSVAALIFAKYDFRGKKIFYAFVIALMMIPVQVMIVPIYIMYTRFGLMQTQYSVILAYAVGTIPFTVFLLTAGFRGVPNAMIESAKLEGASFFKLLYMIVIPVSRASVITVIIFNFIAHWKELIIGMLFLQKDDLMTVTAAVATIMRRWDTDYPYLLTGLLVSSIPPLLIYLVFQKYIISGMTVGSVK